MNSITIDAYDNQYNPRGGSWNQDTCLVNGIIETYSGPGSLLKNTENIINQLPIFLKKYNITSIIDIPCGDFNYMKRINLDNIKYNGYDISKKAIDICSSHKSNNINFSVFDATSEQLQYSDLIICKDLFLHLSFEHIHTILKNIIHSKCKYFAVSRYDNGNVTNIDQISGLGARAIEITNEPFNFNYNIIERIRYTNNGLQDELIIFKMF
jgi:hypothetical protein